MNFNEADHIWDFPNEEETQTEMLQTIRALISLLICETGLNYDSFFVVVDPISYDERGNDIMGNFALKGKISSTVNERKAAGAYPYRVEELAMITLGFMSGYNSSGESKYMDVKWDGKQFRWVREGNIFFYKEI